jgi:D-amino-acid dehydrogenase
MVRLAEYSNERMVELRGLNGLNFDGRERGTLQLFRTQKQLDHIHGDVEVLKQYGVRYEVLDPRACVAAEPGLATAAVPFVGALRLPNDDTGDCKLFTEAMARLAAAAGVVFQFDITVDALQTEGDRITGVATSRGVLSADAYVGAMGSYTPAIVAPLGIRLPVYPIKGYSLTVPIIDDSVAPLSTVMDETYKVATTRFDDRIRVGGTAEIAGWDRTLRPHRRGPLERSLRDLFPRAGDVGKATFWCGLRPMTPDGTPVIGKTRYGNFYLNTGHGTLGWTMAAGSGQVMADLVSGKQPEIDTSDLGLSRYGG